MSAKKPNVERDVTINKSEFKAAVVRHLHCTLGTDENKANNHAWWKATCSAMQGASAGRDPQNPENPLS